MSGRILDYTVFQVLGSRCLTGSALLDCHVLKGFGIYMIGILGRPYCPEWKTEVLFSFPRCKLLCVNTIRLYKALESAFLYFPSPAILQAC